MFDPVHTLVLVTLAFSIAAIATTLEYNRRMRRALGKDAVVLILPSNSSDLTRDPDYWYGMAAGVRFLHGHPDKTQLMTCWHAYADDIEHNDEPRFAMGWHHAVRPAFEAMLDIAPEGWRVAG